MDFLKLLRNDDIKGLEEYIEKHGVNEEVQGQSLLYWVVYMNNIKFAKVLIDHGADVNRKDSLGRSPLTISCFFGFLDLIELLLEYNAIVEDTCLDKSYFGWNGHRQEDVIKLLMKSSPTNNEKLNE